MDRFIGMDTHSQTCTLRALTPTGKEVTRQVVETNGAGFKLSDRYRARSTSASRRARRARGFTPFSRVNGLSQRSHARGRNP